MLFLRRTPPSMSDYDRDEVRRYHVYLLVDLLHKTGYIGSSFVLRQRVGKEIQTTIKYNQIPPDKSVEVLVYVLLLFEFPFQPAV